MQEPRFTAKEVEIMQLICRQKSSKEIAGIVHLAYRTIEKYRERIMEKTGSVNLVGMVNFAIVNGIYDPRENEPSLFKALTKRNNTIEVIDPVRYLKTNKDTLFQILLTTPVLAFLWDGNGFQTIDGGIAQGVVVTRDLLIEEFYVARRYAILHFEHSQTGFLRVVNFPGSSECAYYDNPEQYRASMP